MKFPWLINLSLILGIGLLVACDNSQSAVPGKGMASPDTGGTANITTGRPVAKHPVATQKSDMTYQSVFAQALTKGPWGEPSLLAQTLPSQGGLECSPRAITGHNPKFSITLPEKVEDRRHSLIAITAGGGILTIYQPQDASQQDAADVLPINAELSWPLAQIQRTFELSAFAFDGLYKDDVKPSGIFLNKGVYIVALVNGADAQALSANGAKPIVYAACSIHWTP